MQYRGYDCYGIAYYEQNKLVVKKHLGPIVNVNLKSDSNIAIGHTRWATHGSVNLENTHPITYKDFSIVHNGIIANVIELKEKILSFPWSSETDTEVILALLSEHQMSLVALQNVFDQLKGSFAFVIMWNKKIYFGRKGVTPLYIIKAKQTIDIISDISAIDSLGDLYAISVEDGQIGMVEDMEITMLPESVFQIKNFKNQKRVQRKYDSWFEEEFFSQPSKIVEALSEDVEWPTL
jgi:glucosamine--fructose-6-phosphate aminotransferase (isomerizing)